MLPPLPSLLPQLVRPGGARDVFGSFVGLAPDTAYVEVLVCSGRKSSLGHKDMKHAGGGCGWRLLCEAMRVAL